MFAWWRVSSRIPTNLLHLHIFLHILFVFVCVLKDFTRHTYVLVCVPRSAADIASNGVPSEYAVLPLVAFFSFAADSSYFSKIYIFTLNRRKIHFYFFIIHPNCLHFTMKLKRNFFKFIFMYNFDDHYFYIYFLFVL